MDYPSSVVSLDRVACGFRMLAAKNSQNGGLRAIADGVDERGHVDRDGDESVHGAIF